MKTQLIDRALASNFYDFVIEEEDDELDPVRSFKDIHSNPGFFSLTMATRKEESFGRSRKKMYTLMVETGVLSIDHASEWGDTMVPLENIMKFLYSVLIHHDKNNSSGPNCDATAYPKCVSNKEINKIIRKQ